MIEQNPLNYIAYLAIGCTRDTIRDCELVQSREFKIREIQAFIKRIDCIWSVACMLAKQGEDVTLTINSGCTEAPYIEVSAMNGIRYKTLIPTFKPRTCVYLDPSMPSVKTYQTCTLISHFRAHSRITESAYLWSVKRYGLSKVSFWSKTL